jgi:hypothetical protein
MKEETMLIIAAALAVGIGVWSLQKPVTQITEPIGDFLHDVNPFHWFTGGGSYSGGASGSW